MKKFYRCEHCKHNFEELNEVVFREDRGEFWGTPVYEDLIECRCPFCDRDSSYIEEYNLCEIENIIEQYMYFDLELTEEIFQAMDENQLDDLKEKIDNFLSKKFGKNFFAEYSFNEYGCPVVEELYI